MTTSHNTFLHLGKLCASMLALAGLIAVTGCEGGGGSDGSSTIQGNVSQYSGSVAVYVPDEPHGWLTRIASSVGDLLAPHAFAASIEGVTVTVEGTDLSAVTDGNGHFVISGVPIGAYTLILSFGGQTASYPINVAEDNSTVTLEDIEVEHGVVSVSDVHIEIESESDDDGDDSNDDNGDDNSGSGSDDDSDDDEDDDNSGSGSDDDDSDDDDDDDDNSGSGSDDD